MSISEKLKLDFNCSLNGFSLTKEILDETIYNVSLIFNEAANGTALVLLLLLSIAAFLNRHIRFHISLLPMVVITSGILSQICSTVEMRLFKIYKDCGFLILFSSLGGEFFGCVTFLALLFFRLDIRNAPLIPCFPQIGKVFALGLIVILSLISAFAIVFVQGTTMSIVSRSVSAFILFLSLMLALLGVKKKNDNNVGDITMNIIEQDSMSLGSRLENPVESNAKSPIRPPTADASVKKTIEETTKDNKKEKKTKKTLEETLSQLSGDEKDPKDGGVKKKKEQPKNTSLKYVQQDDSIGSSSKEVEAEKENKVKVSDSKGTFEEASRNVENAPERSKKLKERDMKMVEAEMDMIFKKIHAELRVALTIIIVVMFLFETFSFYFLSSSSNLVVKMINSFVPYFCMAYWFYIFMRENEKIGKVLKEYDLINGKRVPSADEVVVEDDVVVYGTMA